LVSRRVAVVSGGAAGFVLLPSTGAGLVALSILIIVGLAWFTGIDGHWAAALISLLVPLYARIKRESVLDHFLRGRIVEFLAHNSTTSFSAIRERFGVANGVLSYHLWVLERTGFVGTVSRGGSRLYHVIGSRPKEGVILSEFQHALMTRIRARAMMSIQELARELETSKQRVHYNVKFLAKQGLLQVGNKPRPVSVRLTQAGSGFIETDAESDAGQSRGLSSSRADDPYSP
jgi:DNA-binding MarR family transcriptional regulator